MFMKLLALELKEARPKTKYFLAAFVREFGVNDPVQKLVKELSVTLGISTSEITKATNFLVENDFFTRGEMPSVRGRPKWYYGCSTKLVEMLEQQQHPLCSQHHKSLIIEMFHSELNQYKKSDCQSLQISNKLLLAVMLAHADESGVVRTLGRSNLRKLTGMSDDLLKAQIGKLLDKGFIRSYVPGGTNSLLFGAGVGAYFLNLTKIRTESASQGTILFYEDMHLDIVLIKLYREMNQQPDKTDRETPEWLAKAGMTHEDHEKLAHYFSQKPTHGFKLFFILKINEYASYCLSKHWRNLFADNLTDNELIKKIRSDVLPSSRKTNEADSNAADVWNTLAKLLHNIAFMAAKNIANNQFRTAKEIDYEEMNHVILPDPEHFGFRTVELHSKKKSKGPNHWFISEGKPIEEAEMTLHDKYSYGLLTKPRRTSSAKSLIPE
ncbi:hypothetical protein [Amphritea sp.]|uniref:hypothetical protein n=1 Tax=Amphritea sp. TaxID=1872502 RepID=UPI003A8CD6E4